MVFAHELFHLYDTDKRDENSDTIPNVLIKVDQLVRSFFFQNRSQGSSVLPG